MPDDLIIGEGSEQDRKAIKLATKRGRWIKNVRRREMPPEQLRAAVEVVRGKFSALTLRSISATYNCYGMVFASRRTCIVDGNEILNILSDDEYLKVTDRRRVNVGDVVIYRSAPAGEITHAGIVIEKRPRASAGADATFMILSQWGASGEWIHHEETVLPQLGSGREFYSERKSIRG
jgi:hypothetical protein